MRKNRRISKKMSVMATTSMRFGAIIVVFFVMVILYILSSSSCNQLLKVKGDLERTIAKLEDSCARESSHWEEMQTDEKIEKTLRVNGLEMRPPKPERQVVRMMENGKLRPGQPSVAAARRRVGAMSAAVDASASSVTSASKYARRKVRQ